MPPYGGAQAAAQYASPSMNHTFKALQDAGYGQGASAPAPMQNMRPTFEKPTIYTVRTFSLLSLSSFSLSLISYLSSTLLPSLYPSHTADNAVS
jgi:hypothetical protein